jgi:hypothetical protein
VAEQLLLALALMLIVEGLLPMISPCAGDNFLHNFYSWKMGKFGFSDCAAQQLA